MMRILAVRHTDSPGPVGRVGCLGSVVLLLGISILMCLPRPASAEFVRLYAEDFPCETVPSKCPSGAVDLLLRLKDAFPEARLTVPVRERLYVDTGGVCDQLYVEAGGQIVVPLNDLEVDFSFVRDPEAPFYEHTILRLHLRNVVGEISALFKADNCLLFIDFSIPVVGTQFWLGDLLAVGWQKVWLDTDSDQVFLTDALSGVLLGDVKLDIPGVSDTLEDLIVPDIADEVVAGLLDDALVDQGGALFDLAEGAMDELYRIRPLGFCAAVSPTRGLTPAGNVAVNSSLLLLPLAVVVCLRRRLSVRRRKRDMVSQGRSHDVMTSWG